MLILISEKMLVGYGINAKKINIYWSFFLIKNNQYVIMNKIFKRYINMKKVLDKQELLWFVVEEIYAKQTNKQNKIIFKQAKHVLRFNLNKELAEQLDLEIMVVFNALQDLIDNDYQKEILEVIRTDSEDDIINIIYHTISLGKEQVLKFLNKEIDLVKYYKKNKYNDKLTYAIPYYSDYNEPIILESIEEEEEEYNKKIKILKDSKHLHPDYVNEIIEKSKYFIKFIDKIKNNENIKYNKKEYSDKFKEFVNSYIYANDYIARVNNKDSNCADNMLISYIYENTINDYINEKKYKKFKYDLSKFDKQYIAEYKNPTIKIVRQF